MPVEYSLWVYNKFLVCAKLPPRIDNLSVNVIEIGSPGSMLHCGAMVATWSVLFFICNIIECALKQNKKYFVITNMTCFI